MKRKILTHLAGVAFLAATLTSHVGVAADAPSDSAADLAKTADARALLDGQLKRFSTQGLAALEKGDLDTGRARFQQVLDLDPNNIVALVNLGSLEYRAGHGDEAEKILGKATRLEPRTFSAWLTLGVITCEAGKLNAALAALAQAVLLDPSNAKAHSYLGVTIGRKGWLDGAEAELQRALELDETFRDAHFNLAVIYLQRNPPAVELARRHYFRAIELGSAPDSLVEKQLNRGKE